VPFWLPLFFSSDHGVDIYSTMDSNILDPNSKIKIHFTWSSILLEKHKNLKQPKLKGAVHPWIHYKKINKIQRPETTKGTIVFPIHTTGGARVSGYDAAKLIEHLNGLPQSYRPITICLHQSDLDSERHKLFTMAGYDVTSAGNIYSSDFVDNFYDLISKFEFAISEGWGSQVAYLVDFGVPTQIVPRNILVTSASTGEEIVGGNDAAYQAKLRQAEKLFGATPSIVTPNQLEFIHETLGFNYFRPRIVRIVEAYFYVLRVGLPWILTVLVPRNLRAFANWVRN